MDARVYDWKDVANSQFDKALTLALLVLLFCVVVTPRVDVKKQTFSLEQMKAVDLDAEERVPIKPPEVVVKPVDIQIDDTMTGGDATDPDLLNEALKTLGGDIYSTTNTGGKNNAGNDERPFEFVPYEDPPVPENPKAPEYTDFAKKSGIQGTVVLEVDVYKDGALGKINVIKSLLKGPGGLDEAAVNAVKKWKFQPGKSGGKAVDTTVIIPVEFTLTRN